MQLPEHLSGFINGLCAASNSVWDQGGLMLEAVAEGASIEWLPQTSSPDALLLEFLSCVIGNRSLERRYEAKPALTGLVAAIQYSFPSYSPHLEVEEIEGSWCYRLHVLLTKPSNPQIYFRLFWSVD